MPAPYKYYICHKAFFLSIQTLLAHTKQIVSTEIIALLPGRKHTGAFIHRASLYHGPQQIVKWNVWSAKSDIKTNFKFNKGFQTYKIKNVLFWSFPIPRRDLVFGWHTIEKGKFGFVRRLRKSKEEIPNFVKRAMT